MPSDAEALLRLYKAVSRRAGGIARLEKEITTGYIDNIMHKSAANGVQLVVEDLDDCNRLIAEIHCYKLEPTVFRHVLSELTAVVDPSFQRRGIGAILFSKLCDHVRNERTDILRVELIARESNTSAIRLYKRMGFVAEGRLEQRINCGNGTFEADIPMAWLNPMFIGTNN